MKSIHVCCFQVRGGGVTKTVPTNPSKNEKKRKKMKERGMPLPCRRTHPERRGDPRCRAGTRGSGGGCTRRRPRAGRTASASTAANPCGICGKRTQGIMRRLLGRMRKEGQGGRRRRRGRETRKSNKLLHFGDKLYHTLFAWLQSHSHASLACKATDILHANYLLKSESCP